MSLKLSAFPKCYIDRIAGDRTMSVFDWIEMARSLDADGLEMYDGFFTSLEPAYLDQVGEAIHAAGFVMPMLCVVIIMRGWSTEGCGDTWQRTVRTAGTAGGRPCGRRSRRWWRRSWRRGRCRPPAGWRRTRC